MRATVEHADACPRSPVTSGRDRTSVVRALVGAALVLGLVAGCAVLQRLTEVIELRDVLNVVGRTTVLAGSSDADVSSNVFEGRWVFGLQGSLHPWFEPADMQSLEVRVGTLPEWVRTCSAPCGEAPAAVRLTSVTWRVSISVGRLVRHAEVARPLDVRLVAGACEGGECVYLVEGSAAEARSMLTFTVEDGALEGLESLLVAFQEAGLARVDVVLTVETEAFTDAPHTRWVVPLASRGSTLYVGNR